MPYVPEGTTTDTFTDTYRSALALVGRGWQVIPVYGIREGSGTDARCECGTYPCNAGNQNAGKHPVGRDWNQRGLTSGADLYATFAESRRNVGVLTGAASGIWVLDIDPKNGGDVTLTRLLREHGPLPATYKVRTGSGGEHYYFSLPDFKLGNSPRGFNGLGIDVRSDGGQVVGAGSVSWAGRYDVINDVDVAAAPGWLLDMLRAPEVTGSAAEPTLVEGLPSYGDLDESEQRRVQRYAEAIIGYECDAYAIEPPGYGSIKMFSVACRLLEVVQSPWNVVTADWAYGKLDAARQRRLANHPERERGGGQSRDEMKTTWSSARSRVVGKGVEYPQPRGAGLMLDVEPLPPRPGEQSTSLRSVDLTDFTDVEPEAREDAGSTTGAISAVDALIAEMLTPDDLENLPNPQPLIMNLLDLDSESWLISEPGGFKSFVALDWAAHVSMGLDWQGQRVRQGSVVYVVAEGSKGIKLRARAWRQTYGQMGEIRFLPRPVQVGDGEAWGVLVQACAQLQPSMIVLDTQARITVGLDENQAKDMGQLVEAVRKLREATKACVLVVHHVGRNGGDARGSSALDGAQDTEIRVSRPAGKQRKRLTATVGLGGGKQKDGSEDVEFKIKLKVHNFGIDPETGRDLTSLAIEPFDPSEVKKVVQPDWVENITEYQLWVMEVMRDHSDEIGATPAMIKRWLKDRGREIKDNSVYSAIRDLKVKKPEPLLTAVGARVVLSELTD